MRSTVCSTSARSNRVYVRYRDPVDAKEFARLGEVVRGKIVLEVGAGEWPRF